MSRVEYKGEEAHLYPAPYDNHGAPAGTLGRWRWLSVSGQLVPPVCITFTMGKCAFNVCTVSTTSTADTEASQTLQLAV